MDWSLVELLVPHWAMVVGLGVRMVRYWDEIDELSEGEVGKSENQVGGNRGGLKVNIDDIDIVIDDPVLDGVAGDNEGPKTFPVYEEGGKKEEVKIEDAESDGPEEDVLLPSQQRELEELENPSESDEEVDGTVFINGKAG
ncbi:hypothetical protein ABW19_dt0206108 [Dactylella cylindrospora]|nr:hypothetical protein ABW19_dt0206108 [Dactylella cylindrospora]